MLPFQVDIYPLGKQSEYDWFLFVHVFLFVYVCVCVCMYVCVCVCVIMCGWWKDVQFGITVW